MEENGIEADFWEDDPTCFEGDGHDFDDSCSMSTEAFQAGFELTITDYFSDSGGLVKWKKKILHIAKKLFSFL